MITKNDEKGAAVKFPPSLIFLIVILATYGLHCFWPIRIGDWSVLKYIGAAVVVFGIGVIIIAERSFKHSETIIKP